MRFTSAEESHLLNRFIVLPLLVLNLEEFDKSRFLSQIVQILVPLELQIAWETGFGGYLKVMQRFALLVH